MRWADKDTVIPGIAGFFVFFNNVFFGGGITKKNTSKKPKENFIKTRKHPHYETKTSKNAKKYNFFCFLAFFADGSVGKNDLEAAK